MSIYINNYELNTNLYSKSKVLSDYDKVHVKLIAQQGNPLSCFYASGKLFLAIQHDDRFNDKDEYNLLFVNDIKLSSLSGYRFLNTVVERIIVNKEYTKNIYHVFIKKGLVYPTD